MKYRQISNLLWVSIFICTLLRVIQIVFTLDAATGFMKQQYSKISILISFIVIATTLAITILSNVVEDMDPQKKTIQPMLAIASLLTGGMFLYEMVASTSALKIGFISGSVMVALALASAIVFMAYGLKNIYEYNFPNIALVVPVIYYVAKLINLFVSTSMLSLVTKNVFMLFANAALLLFMFEFSSFENEFKGEAQKPKKLFIIAIGTTMICMVTGLPTIFAAILQKIEYSKGDVASSLLVITQAIFIFVYTKGRLFKKDTKPTPVSKHSA